MDTMILQVPVSKALKQQAEIVARDYGFSSLQESVRIFLKKLATRAVTIDISPTEEHVTLSSAAKRRYAKMSKDFHSGNDIYRATSVSELMNHLHED